MSSNMTRTSMPPAENGTVHFCGCSLASAIHDVWQGELSGSVAHLSLSCGSASPPLNSLQRSRAVLLADRLHGSPLQVMAHRILPGTGHEVPCEALALTPPAQPRPGPQQSQECIPDPNPQRQQRIANLVWQDSRRLDQERPQDGCMRHVPLPRGDGPLRRTRSRSQIWRLFRLLWSWRGAGRIAGLRHA
jgi:hypothetical protein